MILIGSRNNTLPRLYEFSNDLNLVQVVELSGKLILISPHTTINILDPDNFTSTCSTQDLLISLLNGEAYNIFYVC